MTVVCLIRHGQSEWNAVDRMQGRADPPLSAKGRTQAEQCGRYLIGESWDKIVSSPLQRARDTAAIIGETLGQSDVVEMEDFSERDVGLATGLTPQEAGVRFTDGQIPGREDDQTLEQRAMKGLAKVTAAFGGKRVIIVCHGGVIGAILKAVSDGKLGLGQLRIQNASLTVLHFDDRTWDVRSVNGTEHLHDSSSTRSGFGDAGLGT